MKLSKTKKIILLGTSIGILTAVIIPIILINQNDNQDQQNKKDVESVVKILEEKNQNERILKFASSLTGKIVANNQEKIVAKIKTLIGTSNLKDTKIEILMENDQDISPNFTKIQIKVSKGKYSKTVDLEKPYFVTREQNEQEIIADVNSVKTALTNLKAKTLELKAKDDDKSINANKKAILKTLTEVKGYLEINFKKVEIKLKENSNNLPLYNTTPISITFILSKGAYTSEITGFKARQLAPEQVNIIRRELNQLKSSLGNLETKEVEVYAPSEDKTITHNKGAIKNAIENLDGYDTINFNGASLEVKNSNDNLPNNNQVSIAIILILSKNNVNVEVQGFSAKQSLTITPQGKINQIKEKIIDKDILIPANVSTQNQSEIQSAIKNQLQKENPSLNNDDLAKISTSLLVLTLGTRTKASLIITVDSTISTLNIDVEKANLLKGSKIENGSYGTIFQDAFKNLWAMGSSVTKTINGVQTMIHTKLQVLKANQNKDGYVTSWTNDNGENGEPLLNGSNIVEGNAGKIFQDAFKNLWAMGKNQKLQVLKANSSKNDYVNTGWINDNSMNGDALLKKSNINDGQGGIIFQDAFKNLWAMGKNSKLQVLRVNSAKDGYVNTGWDNNNSSSATGLTKNSNITDGQFGTIFQDAFKNLWAIGLDSKLQVLRANIAKDGYVSNGWDNNNSSSATGLTKNSNMGYGLHGVIFQDEFKNLWAMGNYEKLQVLRVNSSKNGYVNTGWNSDNSNSGIELLKGSNVSNGANGNIFQDKFKNLWVMSLKSKPQVLRANPNKDGYVNTGWNSDNSNSATGLLKGSNINYDSQGGKIFQDEFKNLWMMANNTTFQVLRTNLSKNGYVNTGWNNDINTGLTKASSIVDGNAGTIFQDAFKNLWAMGSSVTKTINGVQTTIHTKLQVLKVNQNGDGYVDSWQKPGD